MSEEIRPVLSLAQHELQPLLASSLEEGYKFVQTLWDEYASGKTRFDSIGAALYGVYADGTLVAVGGVHRDPYLDRPDIGRIRHVYVMPKLRRSGVGRRLMSALIAHSHDYFEILTLRTAMANADAFYVSLGFSREPRFDHATHWLSLEG